MGNAGEAGGNQASNRTKISPARHRPYKSLNLRMGIYVRATAGVPPSSYALWLSITPAEPALHGPALPALHHPRLVHCRALISGIDSGIDSSIDSGIDSGIDSSIDSAIDSGNEGQCGRSEGGRNQASNRTKIPSAPPPLLGVGFLFCETDVG